MILKTDNGVVVNTKLISLIACLTEWNDSTTFSLRLKDIDESFWFNSKEAVQEFLNVQDRERFFDKECRKGYFDYINENGEKVRYTINKQSRGKIIDFSTEIVA